MRIDALMVSNVMLELLCGAIWRDTGRSGHRRRRCIADVIRRYRSLYVVMPTLPWTVALATLPLPAEAQPIVGGFLHEPPIILYDGIVKSCDASDGLDAPARAFRDQNGNIHLFASNQTNRQSVGRNLTHMNRSCDKAFAGSRNSDPEAYDDQGWLTSFYTFDGLHVDALVHNEFEGYLRPGSCTVKGPPACWEISLGAVHSDDGGYSFQRVSGPERVVAAYPFGFNSRSTTFDGYMNPTNVVRKGKLYYVFFGLKDPVNGISGTSAMATNDPHDPKSWRGWDGSGFTISFLHSAKESTTDLKSHNPHLIGTADTLFGVGSISRYERCACYVAAMRYDRFHKPVSSALFDGIYISSSYNLITWSRPQLLLSDDERRKQTGNPNQVDYYPALLDPESNDRNFTTISDHPFLTTVLITHGSPMRERKLLAWQVDLVIDAGRKASK